MRTWVRFPAPVQKRQEKQHTHAIPSQRQRIPATCKPDSLPNGNAQVQPKDSSSKSMENSNWRRHPMPISCLYTFIHIHRYACAYIHTHRWERLLGHFQWLIYTYPLPSTLLCSLQTKMLKMHQQAAQHFNQWKALARDQRVKTRWSQGAYSLDTVQQVPTGCLHPCFEGHLPLGSLSVTSVSPSLPTQARVP